MSARENGGPAHAGLHGGSDADGGRMSKLPTCIPVAWTSQGVYHLAYHHGFTDQRLYSICRMASGVDDIPTLLATVDDFGDLVTIAEQRRWDFGPTPLIPVWIQRGDMEVH